MNPNLLVLHASVKNVTMCSGITGATFRGFGWYKNVWSPEVFKNPFVSISYSNHLRAFKSDFLYSCNQKGKYKFKQGKLNHFHPRFFVYDTHIPPVYHSLVIYTVYQQFWNLLFINSLSGPNNCVCNYIAISVFLKISEKRFPDFE